MADLLRAGEDRRERWAQQRDEVRAAILERGLERGVGGGGSA
jgi:hypothetical protein